MSCIPVPTDDNLSGPGKLQSGDFESYRFLYSLFYPELINQAKALLSIPAHAPRVIKHCYIDCWLQSERFSSLDYALGFLLSALNKNCIDFNNGNVPDRKEQIINALSADAVLEGENHETVLNHIKSLPVTGYLHARKIFSYYYRRQLPVSQIAGQMHLTQAQVQDQLNIAFKILYLIFQPSI